MKPQKAIIKSKKINKKIALTVLLAAYLLCTNNDFKQGFKAGYAQAFNSKTTSKNNATSSESLSIIFPLIKFN